MTKLFPKTVSHCSIGWAGAGAIVLILCAAPAQAQDGPPKAGDLTWQVGTADVMFNSSGRFTLGGAPVPGGDTKLSNNITAVLAADYYVRPDMSLSLTIGVPPKTTAKGEGSLAPLGRLGAVRYGPAVALAKYHVQGLGAVRPWLGAGVTRMLVFSESDGAISNLKVRPAWGGAVETGVEYNLNRNWGVYTSLSHLFLKSSGTGVFSGQAVTAKVTMDPTIVQVGLTFRR